MAIVQVRARGIIGEKKEKSRRMGGGEMNEIV